MCGLRESQSVIGEARGVDNRIESQSLPRFAFSLRAGVPNHVPYASSERLSAVYSRLLFPVPLSALGSPLLSSSLRRQVRPHVCPPLPAARPKISVQAAGLRMLASPCLLQETGAQMMRLPLCRSIPACLGESSLEHHSTQPRSCYTGVGKISFPRPENRKLWHLFQAYSYSWLLAFRLLPLMIIPSP
jgi:hypothetical protein